MFVNCLVDGIFIPLSGSRYFYVRENGVLSSTCYVYGVPIPSLDCRTYDNAGTQLAALPPVRRNYTSSPVANRMVFRNIQRAVARVRCVIGGGATRQTVEKIVRVDRKCKFHNEFHEQHDGLVVPILILQYI